jgi:hypothetical protein
MVMSALPPKADMCSATKDVCFGPKADTTGIPLALITLSIRFNDPRLLRIIPRL